MLISLGDFRIEKQTVRQRIFLISWTKHGTYLPAHLLSLKSYAPKFVDKFQEELQGTSSQQGTVMPAWTDGVVSRND